MTETEFVCSDCGKCVFHVRKLPYGDTVVKCECGNVVPYQTFLRKATEQETLIDGTYEELTMAISMIRLNIDQTLQAARKYKIPIHGHRQALLGWQELRTSVNHYLRFGKPHERTVHINDINKVYTMDEVHEHVKARYEGADVEIHGADNVVMLYGAKEVTDEAIEWFAERNIAMHIRSMGEDGIEVNFCLKEEKSE